jgi:hypothetical protein
MGRLQLHEICKTNEGASLCTNWGEGNLSFYISTGNGNPTYVPHGEIESIVQALENAEKARFEEYVKTAVA